MGLQGKISSTETPTIQAAPEVSAPAEVAAPKTEVKADVKAESPSPKDAVKAASDSLKKTEPKTYTTVVDGETIVVTEDELLKGYQTARAAHKRFQEASEQMKQAQALKEALKKNPWDVIKEQGLDPDQLAEMRIAERIRQEMMTPEQKALEAEKKARQEMENRLKMFEEKERQVAYQREMQKYRETYEKSFVDALASSGLPKTERTIALMAQYMKSALQAGHEVEAKDIAPLVKEHYQKDLSQLIEALDADTLQQLFPGVADKIRKSDVAKLKNKLEPSRDEKAPAPRKKKEKMTIREYMEKARSGLVD